AIEKVLAVGAAIGAAAPGTTIWDRKNYFYPDLPKGYQISQLDFPLAEHGTIEVTTSAGTSHVRIRRAHLEEDTARLRHEKGSDGKRSSLIDYNRSGVALLEIVTEPDIRDAETARRYAEELRLLLRTIGAADAEMENGQMRVEANVSIRPSEEAPFGTRTEVKNMNSFRFLERGIEAELERQLEVVLGGGTIEQETLHFDPVAGTLSSLRSKEQAHDYRYFPEPDLLPVHQTEAGLVELGSDLPELPAARFDRLVAAGLTEPTALALAVDADLAGYLDAVATVTGDLKTSANWTMGEFSAHLNGAGLSADQSPVTPERLAALIALVVDGTINQTAAKEVFGVLVEDPQATAAGVVADRNLAQVGGDDALGEIIDAVLAAHPEEVEAFRGGREQVIGFLVGQCMKQSGGRADAKALQGLLRARLNG
ncbi:MAG: Asp-tRNA(Asn)/Glu-tRNA(Gln) amidotransferase subunit GatB, partial [Thermoleophilia bacterium]